MLYVILFILGLIFGSFATMASFRLGQGKSMFGRSYCPTCHHVLQIPDLVPLISFIVNGGKCRYCKNDISMRYPIIELLNGTLFVINGVIFKDNLEFVALFCLVTSALVIVIFADLEYLIIPDLMIIILGILGVVFAYLSNYSWQQIVILPLVMGLGALFLQRMAKLFFSRDALGAGDIKFFFVSSFYLSGETIASFMFIAGILALVFGLCWRLRGLGEYFPFAPALCCSLYCCIAFPQTVSNLFLLER